MTVCKALTCAARRVRGWPQSSASLCLFRFRVGAWKRSTLTACVSVSVNGPPGLHLASSFHTMGPGVGSTLLCLQPIPKGRRQAGGGQELQSGSAGRGSRVLALLQVSTAPPVDPAAAPSLRPSFSNNSSEGEQWRIMCAFLHCVFFVFFVNVQAFVNVTAA